MDDFMTHILNPSSGLCNPEKGLSFSYPCNMSGKSNKPIGTKKIALAANVKSLMDMAYAESRNRPKDLAKNAGISLSSVQCAISGETAPTLDTLEALAHVFDLSIGELVDGSHGTAIHSIPSISGTSKKAKEIIDLLAMMDDFGLAIILDKAKDIAAEYPRAKQTQKSSK